MRKNFIGIISVMLAGLMAYSCSDIMPEQVEIQGTARFGVSTGAVHLGSVFTSAIEDAFPENPDKDFTVNIYDAASRSEAQAFCIDLHFEMTEGLDPGDYLRDIKDMLDGVDIGTTGINEGIPIPSFDQKLELPLTLDMGNVRGLRLTRQVINGVPFNPSVTAISENITMENTGDFLHAKIGTGAVKVELTSTEIENFIVEYSISISQNNNGVYSGLNKQITRTDSSLNGQDINASSIALAGTVTIKPGPGGATLNLPDGGSGNVEINANLKVTMEITRLAEVDFDFNNIKNKLKTGIPKYSLAETARYVKVLEFAEYDEGTPDTGIGINITFENSGKLLAGLDLSLACEALEMPGRFRPLEESNIFANEEDVSLVLAADPPRAVVEELVFNLELQPKGGGNVLHLEDIDVGEPLGIYGKLQFFQNWTRAVINMTEAVHHESFDEEGAFTGTFPEENANGNPVDLSEIKKYLEGFTFEDIEAQMYLSGPGASITELDAVLNIDAEYQNTSANMYSGALTLGNPVSINDYLDQNKRYTKSTLPEGGMEINLSDVINAWPEKLTFRYDITLPDELEVFPDMFENITNAAEGSGSMSVDIMLMLPLRLVAGVDGGTMLFPDMFEGKKDLLGRDEPKELFESMDIESIVLSLNFVEPLFNNGKLFLTDNRDDDEIPDFFPEGIKLNGTGITFDITGADITTMRENLIRPNVSLRFDPAATVSVPRNTGVAGVSFGIKGKVRVGDL